MLLGVHTLEEELLGSLEEAGLGFGGGDGVELAESGQPVRCVIGIPDSTEERGEICLEPDLWSRFMSVTKSVNLAMRFLYQRDPPLATEVDGICVNTSRNANLDANIDTRKGVEATGIGC
jgi:hypothetical protein